MKDTFVDVKARLKSGKYIIIEMQVLNVKGFEKRILHNATKQYSQQLKKGSSYQLVNPVIALTFTNFRMFDDSEEYISRLSKSPFFEQFSHPRFMDIIGDGTLVP